MEIREIAERLHELERKVLLALKEKDNQLSTELVRTAGIDEASVNRALLWLKSKGLVNVKEEIVELIALDANGENYVKSGLPEKRFVSLVLDGFRTLSELREKLGKDEFNVSIGMLKGNDYIKIKEGVVEITKRGLKWFKELNSGEKLLSMLEKGPVNYKSLGKELQHAATMLFRRKRVIKQELKTMRTASLTQKGKEVLPFVRIEELIGELTPNILASGVWKERKFRKYDLKAPSPRMFYGKKGLPSYMIAKIRRIFLDMGFTEMKGHLIETSFWNFDALYQPQDHPAREMHDTFFIKEPYKGELPSKELVKRVARTHENGWTTGSRGWGYDWSEEVASTNVLRTHTTGVSAKTIATLTKEDLPARFFSIDSVFRNETMDYKHLFQFRQVEGIIIGENVTFKNLLGMLKLFFRKLGFEKVRFRPGYFPYTEMSVEPEVFNPVKKDWMELGGAGMFRPEVVKPLIGFEVPVLAWGLAFERPLMDVFNFKDIRDIYSDDINKLRELSAFTRRF